MSFRQIALLALVLLPAAGNAGDFVQLPTSGTLRVTGLQNPSADPLKLTDGPITGVDPGSPPIPPGGSLYGPPSTLEQLGISASSIVYLGNTVGTLYDFVFRDTSDNFLVFGSRVVMGDNNFEINDFFRTGYDGFTVSAGWSNGSDYDLRMYSAARSTTPLLGGPDVYSPDVVNMRSDINDLEGNPRSGYFLLKTNAVEYRTLPGGITLRQSGEEGQPPTNLVFSGFAPKASTPGGGGNFVVPIPAWALILFAGFLVRTGMRRSSP